MSNPPRPAPLPFSRPLPVARIGRDETTDFDIRMEHDEADAIAAFLDILAVDSLRMKGTLSPTGQAGWRVDGLLSGKLRQSCVITLETVTEHIREPVSRCYLPDHEIYGQKKVILKPDSDEDEDEPEPYDTVIDLGALAMETLALARNPYPRSKNAKIEISQFSGPGIAPLRDEDTRPFASLAALKEKLGGNSSGNQS